MALNPTPSGDTHNWNYAKPENDGFSTTITGTVMAIQEVQAMNFGSNGLPSTPKFWENNGQPVWNIRMVLAGPSGGFRTWTITPASKAAREGKKRSVHLDLFKLAGGVNMMDLIGKTIKATTVQPPSGFNYGVGNPRPWEVELVTDVGPFALSEPLDAIYTVPQLLANAAVAGGVMQAPVSQGTAYPTSADVNAGISTPAPVASLDDEPPF
jgi:hypothetical protein